MSQGAASRQPRIGIIFPDIAPTGLFRHQLGALSPKRGEIFRLTGALRNRTVSSLIKTG
ncbi:hypothetical protein HMPREF0185_03017 [Brevundimonas diminuta 470-4]|nr:hypothetical protein HMPREF0185_03017 [Brevundimonas diminuta 470-4]